MKRRTKTAAALLLALSLTAGALPVQKGAVLSGSVITASAAQEKVIGSKVYWQTGDTIDFGASAYINFDDMNDGGTEMSGKHTLTYNKYWTDSGQHLFNMSESYNTFYISSQNTAEPWGIQVTGGDGELGTPYTFKALFMDPAAPQVGSASLTLADDLGLNFYVNNVDADSFGSYALKFTGKCDEDGQSVPLSQKTVNGQTYYYAAAHLSADHMSEKIKAVLMKDGAEQDPGLEYSIMEYLAAAKQDSAVKADAKMLRMMNATETYGAVSQYYFHGGTLTNTAFPTIDNEFLAKKVSYDILPEGAKVSAVLNAKASLRLYLAGSATKGSPDSESEKLMPNEMGTPQPITIGENQYRFSAYTWVSRVLNSADSGEKNHLMAKALYGYVKAAEELAGIPVQSVKITNAPTAPLSGTGGLFAYVFPEDASDKTVTWESSDSSVLRMSNYGGFSTGAAGTVTVTAKAGGKSDSCIIYVSDRAGSEPPPWAGEVG